MKKLIVIGIVAALVVVALGAVAGYAYAQSPTPNPFPFGYGPGSMMGGRGGQYGGQYGGGMMGGRGGMRGGGMMGGYGLNGEPGPMHEYMLAAMAEGLDMTPETLQAELDAGKTMWQVAEAKGLTQEAFTTLMLDARTAALAQAVEAGVITQAQADWMLQRMQGFGQGGFNGGCPMQGGGRGGRWNTQPTQAPGTGG
ncbi:MAG: hypothetical protein ACKOC5_05590 [Chloroflexota bacterium]